MIISASEDRTVRLWDRRVGGGSVSQLSYSGKPFYSVDTDSLAVVCAGTNSEVVFWDLRKLKVLDTFRDSHTDDVTAVRFSPSNPN